MWLFIPYIIIQGVLWYFYQGDFSVLAKSSDVFVILSTLWSALKVDALDVFVSNLEHHLRRYTYKQFRRRYKSRLGSVYWRHFETVTLVIVSLIFQFLQ